MAFAAALKPVPTPPPVARRQSPSQDTTTTIFIEAPTPSTTTLSNGHSFPVAAVASGLAVGVSIVALIIVVWVILARRAKRRAKLQPGLIPPHMTESQRRPGSAHGSVRLDGLQSAPIKVNLSRANGYDEENADAHQSSPVGKLKHSTSSSSSSSSMSTATSAWPSSPPRTARLQKASGSVVNPSSPSSHLTISAPANFSRLSTISVQTNTPDEDEPDFQMITPPARAAQTPRYAAPSGLSSSSKVAWAPARPSPLTQVMRAGSVTPSEPPSPISPPPTSAHLGRFGSHGVLSPASPAFSVDHNYASSPTSASPRSFNFSNIDARPLLPTTAESRRR